ncbi:acyl-coenzyme A thioesterase 13-like [Oratosquilla oratoria]|uniref:acyl-coenzyme A thioesterase 13-like n=1 Tax=Oratosquilla oratoria TaxID=337810 RepID=UPI003F763190
MASKNGLQLARQAMALQMERGFDKQLSKVRIISGGGGKCVAELKIEKEHQNRGGTLHGGLVATLVDTITSIALMTSEKQVLGTSVDLSVSFMKAVKDGEEIVMNAETVKAGKTLAFLKLDIRNKVTGDMVATGTHTVYIK